MKPAFCTTAIVLLLMLLMTPSAVRAAVVYPNAAAPCNGTLQQCINGVPDGEVILLCPASNIDEDLTILKSLTITSAPGCATPVIGGNATTMRRIDVEDNGQGKTVDVNISQLNLVNTRVAASFGTGSGHSFRLYDNYIGVLGDDYPVILYTSVQASFAVDYNRIVVTGSEYGIAFASSPTSTGTNDVLLHGNQITAWTDLSLGGIEIVLDGASTNEVRILSNLIYGFTPVVNVGGIIVWPRGATTNTLTIYNNTIDDVGNHGININPSTGTGSTLATVFNNIVSNAAGNWIQLPDSDQQLSAYTDNNTYYLAGAAGYGSYDPGIEDRNEDPVYTDPANRDYRISPLSPCVDSGLGDESLGAGASDVAGRPRIMGISMDRGAYEQTGNGQDNFAILSDLFDDATLDLTYDYPKGDWMEDGRSLVGTSERKAQMFFPNTAACDICKAHFTVKTSGIEYPGVMPKMWMMLWYRDKQNTVELLIKEGQEKLILRQRVNGVIARKDKFTLPMDPYTAYDFEVENDGSQLILRMYNGAEAVPLVGAAATGRFGFQAKATFGYLSAITIHN